MTAAKPAPVDRAWAACPSCTRTRRLEDGGQLVRPHNRYVPVKHAPDQLPGVTEPCPGGSGLEPVSVAAPAFVPAD